MSNIISNLDLLKLSYFIELNMGLHFPENRWSDLERNILLAATSFGYSDANDFIDFIVSSPLSKVNTELLASHLTINETYFWREPKTFEALERIILPEIQKRKSHSNKSIKIWSAGCSGGEEPYSIAIALRRFIPDFKNWNIEIIATDISPIMLKKAESGIYGKWSFRGTPPWLKQLYFKKIAKDKFEVNPEIKKMVSFDYLNLADNKYPSPINNTNAIDIVYCRNVLMYFNQKRFRKVTKNLYNSLVKGGYLVVSANELSYQNFSDFESINLPEFVLYRKGSIKSKKTVEFIKPIDNKPIDTTIIFEEPIIEVREKEIKKTNTKEEKEKNQPLFLDDKEIKQKFFSGNYQEVINILKDKEKNSDHYLLLVKSLANIGDLDASAKVCETALSKYKLDYKLHFLNATILQYQRIYDKAIASLQKAIFINSDFILAYYSLANIMIKTGNINGALKNYKNALKIMSLLSNDDVVPESEGLTIGRLREMVNSSIHKNASI